MTTRLGRGLFIVFEGGEGSGKTTQCSLLAHTLRARGADVVQTREPGGSPSAEQIRALVVNGARDRFGAEAELLLMLAARAEHVRQTIRPALQRNAIVVCDRYLGSTIAYQGYGRGLPGSTIVLTNDAVTGGLRPDLTLYMVAPVSVGLDRSRARGGSQRFEQEDAAFHKRVANGFEVQMATSTGWREVDATGSVADVQARVLAEAMRAVNTVRV